MTRGWRSILPVLTLAIASPAAAQWTSIGAMPPPARERQALIFRGAQATVTVVAVTPDIVRVRLTPGASHGRDHSYAIVAGDAGDPAATIDVSRDRSSLATAHLRVAITHRPLRITIADATGTVLEEDDAEKGMAFSGRSVRVWKRLPDDAHVYGLGEKNGRLDKRGRQLGGYTYAMWNSDTFAYDGSTDPIYVSVPMFMVVRGGVAHGVFFDNTFRSSFDIGHESAGLLSFGADGGDLNYYVIHGPTPKDVVSRYTALTGRMPLPPRWALGYNQCRYSYYPESKVRFIANNFRARQIPADVIWLDIHYLDGYKPFTWDPSRFPDPAKLVADLRAQGFRLVTIIDPHPKKEVGYAPYDSGLAGHHFVTNPDGTVYEAPVWPSKADRNPGPSVFPDFTRPDTRAWWGSLYASLVRLGVAGIWNDMNEPAVFDAPTGTMPLDVRHDNEGVPTDHREIHNVYGLEMSRATYEGLLALRPNERPFVLTRASFAGGQRYAAMWPGDNTSDWETLRGTIPMLLGMGLSGLTFVGSDIGGFAETPSAELYTRWLQTGVFYPFMRTHTTFGTPDQDPWSYGTAHEAINRRAIELRYELLPHIYDVMHEASETGLPAMRPLVLEFPDDARVYGLDDEFMFGPNVLIAPVLREAITERDVYLPAGSWYDFWTGVRSDGGRTLRVPVTLDSIPIYVRAGSAVFRQPVVQHTGQMSGQPLTIALYPSAAPSRASLYEDDGETLDYSRGAYARRQIEICAAGAPVCTIAIGATEGSYRPAPRDLRVAVRLDGEVTRVTVGATEVPRDATPSDRGTWSRSADGTVTVQLHETPAALRMTLERR